MSWGIQVANGLTITKEKATSASDASATNPLGAVVELDDGRAFRYVKFFEQPAVGMLMTPKLALVNQDVDAAASDNTMTGTADFVASAYSDSGYFVTIDANTGIGQTKRIKSNTANVLTLYSAWDVAIDATSDYQVFSPFVVEMTDAACEAVAGIAISAISAGEYGWMQIGGLGFVRFAGNVNPSVALEGIVASAAEGVACGFTGGGTTADEAAASFGVACVVKSAADSAGQLLPVILNKVIR